MSSNLLLERTWRDLKAGNPSLPPHRHNTVAVIEHGDKTIAVVPQHPIQPFALHYIIGAVVAFLPHGQGGIEIMRHEAGVFGQPD